MIELYGDFIKKILKLEDGEEIQGRDKDGLKFYVKRKGYYFALYYEWEKNEQEKRKNN